MAKSGSVTTWLFDMNKGDESVIYFLWKRYWQRLVKLADEDLTQFKSDAADDAEDVAQRVFTDVWKYLQTQKHRAPRNRAELWRLMLVITYRKIVDRDREFSAKKRNSDYLDESIQQEPAPDWLAVINDDLDRLAELRGESDRKIVVMIMQGFDQMEIAEQLHTSPRTIQRKLALIREAWKKHIE